MGSERRRHMRVSAAIPAWCRVVERDCTGTLMDIAEGGAFVFLSTSGDVGTQAMVRFSVEGTRCEAWGRVTRFVPTPQGIGIGIAFEQCNDGFVHFVRNLAASPQVEAHKFLTAVAELQVFLSDPSSTS